MTTSLQSDRAATDIRPGPAPRRAGRRGRRLAAVGLALACGAFALWEAGFKYCVVAKRWGVVVPGEIYRSGQISKWVLDRQLRQHHIGAVIDLNGVEPTDAHQRYEIERAPQLGLTHRRFPLRGDGTGDIVRYADALEAIVGFRKAGVPVLVHCSAGAQRTGGVVACYRVLVQGWSPQDAVAEMHRYAFRADRDVELIPYLNENVARLAELLEARGVIDHAPSPPPRFAP